MQKRFLTLLLLNVAMLFVFTAHAQNTVSTTGENSETQFVMSTLKIARLANVYDVRLLQSKLVEGMYKKAGNAASPISEGDLLCWVLNDQNQPLETIVIKDPLKIRYEYPDDGGQIGSAIIERPDNELVIRFNFIPGMKYLLIKRIGTDGEPVALATLPLLLN